MMRVHSELNPIVDRYIIGKEKLNWQDYLEIAGIRVVSENNHVRLSVVAKPAGRQRDLMDKLGYNSWRKPSESSK